MKYTIHGYSQEKSIESGLDYLDLGILRWIQDFYPAMKKTIFQNKEYGWFSYSYFLNELPIIGINTKAGLRKRIDKIILLDFVKFIKYNFLYKSGAGKVCSTLNLTKIYHETTSPI